MPHVVVGAPVSNAAVRGAVVGRHRIHLVLDQDGRRAQRRKLIFPLRMALGARPCFARAVSYACMQAWSVFQSSDEDIARNG
ncbi:hypothetical protein CKO28_20830 [Rhodovibrio sodomensis]|uniref:Uncharacterized protein n=1 Tax=Rhodovibrio sodomensis TaxID=1088 RepID=A0ABS1DL04_9PROT|nr:hypothetical protein [Rhodovibrio sodomensis]MBK1670474.1 hypothetical protein [Rhodovibrio sodomensis]